MAAKKRLLVVCGSGIATSTLAMGKVKGWLDKEGLSSQVDTFQGSIQGALNTVDDYDAVVTTTVVPDDLKDKVIDGVGLLTGMGEDEVYAEIKAKLFG
jgi:PTS system galactitol-specific IIB component